MKLLSSLVAVVFVCIAVVALSGDALAKNPVYTPPKAPAACKAEAARKSTHADAACVKISFGPLRRSPTFDFDKRAKTGGLPYEYRVLVPAGFDAKLLRFQVSHDRKGTHVTAGGGADTRWYKNVKHGYIVKQLTKGCAYCAHTPGHRLYISGSSYGNGFPCGWDYDCQGRYINGKWKRPFSCFGATSKSKEKARADRKSARRPKPGLCSLTKLKSAVVQVGVWNGYKVQMRTSRSRHSATNSKLYLSTYSGTKVGITDLLMDWHGRNDFKGGANDVFIFATQPGQRLADISHIKLRLGGSDGWRPFSVTITPIKNGALSRSSWTFSNSARMTVDTSGSLIVLSDKLNPAARRKIAGVRSWNRSTGCLGRLKRNICHR